MRLLLLALLCTAPLFTLAQSDEDIAAFNVAWRAYVEAAKSNRADIRIAAAQDALDAARVFMPETDIRLAMLTQNYGDELVRGANRDAGAKALEEAIDLIEKIEGTDSKRLIPVLASLGDAHSGFGKESNQLKYYKRALKLAASHHGENSIEYADLAFRAATRVFDRSQSTIGRKYLIEAKSIYERSGESAKWSLAMSNFYIGKMEVYHRKTKKAIPHLLRALDNFGGASEKERAARLRVRSVLVHTYEKMGESDLATEHAIEIGRESQLAENQDYEPIFRMPPTYPRYLLRNGVEGYVDIRFQIDESGFVRDPEIIQEMASRRTNGSVVNWDVSQEDRSFRAAALAAVERFRYAPRFVDGEAVPVEGVKTRIAFSIAD
jgi:tetratricopeptide (TPR) repeat protein